MWDEDTGELIDTLWNVNKGIKEAPWKNRA